MHLASSHIYSGEFLDILSERQWKSRPRHQIQDLHLSDISQPTEGWLVQESNMFYMFLNFCCCCFFLLVSVFVTFITFCVNSKWHKSGSRSRETVICHPKSSVCQHGDDDYVRVKKGVEKFAWAAVFGSGEKGTDSTVEAQLAESVAGQISWQSV